MPNKGAVYIRTVDLSPAVTSSITVDWFLPLRGLHWCWRQTDNNVDCLL